MLGSKGSGTKGKGSKFWLLAGIQRDTLPSWHRYMQKFSQESVCLVVFFAEQTNKQTKFLSNKNQLAFLLLLVLLVICRLLCFSLRVFNNNKPTNIPPIRAQIDSISTPQKNPLFTITHMLLFVKAVSDNYHHFLLTLISSVDFLTFQF